MMIRLEKIRLVNWHVFTDTLLDVGQMTLLAGDNGSGKSTIIDAVQYALVANLSHIKFNAAAADRRTGRNLESYCRGKMGADDLDYIRGASLTHVMLQFRGDEAVFCAGIMVDVPGDGSMERVHPWLCSGVPAMLSAAKTVSCVHFTFKSRVRIIAGDF
jgi:energy-coupling factor transporter ATP-binding protein EcfA2